jgi:hypothetical protein
MPIYTIYEIKPLDKELEYSYIGSSKNFTHRKSNHKALCNNYISNGKDRTLYKFMVENGGWDAFNMTPIEEFECDTKTQARIQEQVWIDKNDTKKLNMVKAYITANENEEQRKKYQIDNKEQITKQRKQHYVENTEKILARNKIYREENKEKINEISKQYYANNTEKIAIYREKYINNNKEKIAEKDKKYRKDNKDALKAKRIKYYNENKEAILANKKLYYEKNKEMKKEKN